MTQSDPKSGRIFDESTPVELRQTVADALFEIAPAARRIKPIMGEMDTGDITMRIGRDFYVTFSRKDPAREVTEADKLKMRLNLATLEYLAMRPEPRVQQWLGWIPGFIDWILARLGVEESDYEEKKS